MSDPVQDHAMEEHGMAGNEAALWPCLLGWHRVIHQYDAADHQHPEGADIHAWVDRPTRPAAAGG